MNELATYIQPPDNGLSGDAPATTKCSVSVNSPPVEIKQLYRTVYALAKDLDDHRRSVTTPEQLFDAKAQSQRRQLVQHCDQLIFQPHTLVGQKAREMLWRKGFYDTIAQAKRFWLAAAKPPSKTSGSRPLAGRDAVARLLHEGIQTYMSIVLRMNRYFKLDLHHLVDLRTMRSALEGHTDDPDDPDNANRSEPFPLELISYGLETVHAALLSLGDLHRYHIDLQLDWPLRVERADAARFYHDAFKLNTKVGMAQNQLGTLYAGQSYELDALYHYQYSLVCAVPFEPSESNLGKLFAGNAAELQRLPVLAPSDGNLAVFMMYFIRVSHVCFNDRPDAVPELQSLGHRMLCDLRSLLDDTASRRGSTGSPLNADFVYKLVAVLLFGISRLLQRQSATVHTLNALLVAVCSELVDAANASIDRLKTGRQEQLDHFVEQYTALYDLFDRNMRLNRKANKDRMAHSTDEPTEKPDKTTAPAPLANAGETLNHALQSQSQSTTVSSTSSSQSHRAVRKCIAASAAAAKCGQRSRRRRRVTSEEDFSDDDDSVSLSSTASDESDSDDDDDGSGSDFSSADSDSEADNGSDRPKKSDAQSDSDCSIEGEHFVYPNGTDAAPHSPIESMLFEFLNIADTVTAHRPNVDESVSAGSPGEASTAYECGAKALADSDDVYVPCPLIEDAGNLRYKRRYHKPDPNLIVEFAQHDCTLRALKIIFDWLQVHPQLLTNCYATNPEFVHKIMRLINALNVDLFTRKVFFDRSLLRTVNVRLDFNRMFAGRSAVPLTEDVLLKDFELVRDAQQQLDFELPSRERLTDNEEHMMRLFKLVDFGFYLSKTKLFGYRFCVRTRSFVQLSGPVASRVPAKIGAGGGFGLRRSAVRYQQDKCRLRKHIDQQPRRILGVGDSAAVRVRRGPTNNERETYTSNEENDSVQGPPRKGYLKNRNLNGTTDNASKSVSVAPKLLGNDAEFPQLPGTNGAPDKLPTGEIVAPNGQSKHEIMGKLWLRNEVKTLETECLRPQMHALTPFLVVDCGALVEHSAIVRALLRTRKFVVLVPMAVLAELDSRKKTTEGARKAIRWLEAEISNGGRFLRMQRSYETQSLGAVKTAKKLDRDDLNFVQIAQFCNYMQASHADDSLTDDTEGILTLLTGCDLSGRQSTAVPPLNYAEILAAIGVHFETLTAFFAKYKNK